MRRLTAVLLALLLAAAAWASDEFGNSDYSGGSASGYGGYTLGNKSTVFYACPGTGDQTVDYFKFYGRHSSGATNIKIAIYSTDLSTLIGQSETTSINSSTAQWWTLNPSGTITLTGGTSYAFAFSISSTNGDNLYFYYKTTTSGYCGQQSGNYTETGFPSSLTLGTNITREPAILVGVSAASSEYTVTYDGNGNTGGTPPTDPNSPYEESETVTVLANTGSLVKTGYTFTGWNTAADGSGDAYDATGEDTFSMPANNVTLYAQWLRDGVTYYVDFAAGDDTNNGTSTSTPWKHAPEDVNATGVADGTTLDDGDIVVFKGGVTYEGTVIHTRDGASGNVITFISGNVHSSPWGTGRAVIDGGTTVRGKGFALNGTSYVTIDGFEIRNMKNETDSSGIFIEGASDHVTVRRCLIHDIHGAAGASGYGIEVTGTTTAAYHVIEYNEIYNTEEKGIELYRQGSSTVRYNYVHDTQDHGMVVTSDSNSIYSNIFARAGITYDSTGYRAAYGFKFDGTETILAQSNKFYNNLVFDCSSGIGILNADSNTIVHNTVAVIGYDDLQGSGGQEGACFVIWNDGTAGAQVPDSNLVENNIFYYPVPQVAYSNKYSCVAYNSTIGNSNLIKNNLMYYDGVSTEFVYYHDGSAHQITLATFEGETGISAIGSGNVASGNVHAAPALNGGTGATLLTVAPDGFTGTAPNSDAFELTGDSGAIDIGLNLDSPYNTDILGVSRATDEFDAGAYEYETPTTYNPVVPNTTSRMVALGLFGCLALLLLGSSLHNGAMLRRILTEVEKGREHLTIAVAQIDVEKYPELPDASEELPHA